MTGKPGLVESSVLCYAFDAEEQEKRALASALLAKVWRSKCRLAVSVQNLAEFSVVAWEKLEYALPDELVTRFIWDIVSFDGWEVVSYDAETVLHAVDLSRTHSLHFWDALLAATMMEQGPDTIWSEDSRLSKISSLTVKTRSCPDDRSGELPRPNRHIPGLIWFQSGGCPGFLYRIGKAFSI
jgi:predicted nucleic acid-binding protein